MTPAELAAKGSEAHHQQALFLWRNIALRYGFAAADDEDCYRVMGYVQQTYGINARQVLTPSGKGLSWQDDGGREPVSELEWLHAIPNGGRRDGFTANLMKAEGVKRGICDIFLPLPMRLPIDSHSDGYAPTRFCGLYIEMKRAKSKGKAAGSLSEEQTSFVAYARRVGYAVAVCFTWVDAAKQIRSYIEECRKAY